PVPRPGRPVPIGPRTGRRPEALASRAAAEDAPPADARRPPPSPPAYHRRRVAAGSRAGDARRRVVLVALSRPRGEDAPGTGADRPRRAGRPHRPATLVSRGDEQCQDPSSR